MKVTGTCTHVCRVEWSGVESCRIGRSVWNSWVWTDGMAYVPICTSGTAEWRGMNRRKGVELKKGMEEVPLLYTLYSVEFQRHVAFLFARTLYPCSNMMGMRHVYMCTMLAHTCVVAVHVFMFIGSKSAPLPCCGSIVLQMTCNCFISQKPVECFSGFQRVILG